MSTSTVRPTKKQRELLDYIEQFIKEHGYSPSYREVMNGLDYTSVATVSLHINSLIRRGHLRKRDRSARSLEVVRSTASEAADSATDETAHPEAAWLETQVAAVFDRAEKLPELSPTSAKDLQILVDSLRIIKQDEAAERFSVRLNDLLGKTT